MEGSWKRHGGSECMRLLQLVGSCSPCQQSTGPRQRHVNSIVTCLHLIGVGKQDCTRGLAVIAVGHPNAVTVCVKGDGLIAAALDPSGVDQPQRSHMQSHMQSAPKLQACAEGPWGRASYHVGGQTAQLCNAISLPAAQSGQAAGGGSQMQLHATCCRPCAR